MPSITTHHYFAEDAYNLLDDKIKSKIDNEFKLYQTFAQSHDYLFYYTFNIKNAKRIKDLGHRGHHEKTQEYIVNIIKEIQNKHLENNQQAIAYLYGIITHYVLDSTCHPYIFYKTGIYRKSTPGSIKYRGEHNRMEKDLDAIYYERHTNKKYKYCNITRDIIGKPIFNKELTDLITFAYKKTYNEDNLGYFYQKGIKHARIISSLVVNDYFGIKRFFYRIIDGLTNKLFKCLQAYSTHILNPNLEYLNLEHKTWVNPCNKDLVHNESFEDLYEIALNKTVKIFEEVYKVLYENKELDKILKYIPDLDYATGVPLNESRRMDYFE